MTLINKSIFTLSFISLISINSFGQGVTQKTADKFYKKLSYAQAVDYYKSLTKNGKGTEENVRRTAFCYYNLSDYKNAEKYYKELDQRFSATITENDLLNYLQAAKYNKNYTDAKIITDKLVSKNSNNKVAGYHNANSGYVSELKSDSLNFTITSVKGINTEFSEMCPTFFKKGRLMTFSSNRKNNSLTNKTFAWDDSYFLDLWQATKKDTIEYTNNLPLNKKISSTYHDGPVAFSADEKTMYMTRSNYLNKKVGQSTEKIVNLKLFVLKYDSASKQWSEPVSFEYNSDEYSVGHAAINKEGDRMYFISDMPGGFGQSDIYSTDFKDGKWQKPENLGPAINTEGREMFPYVHEDGTLFFSTDGRAGVGGLDVYFSPVNIDQYFEPQNVGYPLNTNMDDFGFFLDNDLLSGYVSSNRPGGKGKDDIYYFTSKTPIISTAVTGVVYDENTKQPLKNAVVYLINETNTAILDTAKVDETGRYMFNIKKPGKKYKIAARERSRYYDKVIAIDDLMPGDNVKDIYMYPKYKLMCTVFDAKTKSAVEGVKITIIPKFGDDKREYTTNGQGTVMDAIRNKKLGDKVAYAIKFEKEGYLTTVQQFEAVIDSNTILNFNEKINCFLQKKEVGIDITKTYNIKQILFDLGKWDVRPDAAIELDKIVTAMKDNPDINIELGAHTDCRGKAAANLKLSDKRAKSSADYIVSKGIPKSRITGKGYGESKLVNGCACEGKVESTCSEEEHQANRRTEFRIVKF